MILNRLLIIPIFVLLPIFSFSQAVSPYLYGINAWMPHSFGTFTAWGILDQLWGKVNDCHVKLIRIGGIAADRYQATNKQYISMIDSIRKVGAEPLVQVPYNNGAFTATNAANLVKYINISCARKVKYWTIANEPDGQYPNFTATTIATYFKSFATAMKAIDPTIKIVGPDLSWLRSNIYSSLIGGADDITGKDTNGNYYLDIVSYHTYPNKGLQVRSSITDTCPSKFENNATLLVGWINRANKLHARTGSIALTWAVTEFNINYANPVVNDAAGLGCHGFINGQFWAESLGTCMKYNAFAFIPWSVHESRGARTTTDFGFLDGATGQFPRSSFYHLQMMSTYNKTNYAPSTDNQPLVKVISTKDTTGTTVMICNQELTASFAYTVRLDKNFVTAKNVLKINVDNSLAVQYSPTASIPAQATHLLLFNSAGVIQKIIEYTLTDAINQKPPRSISIDGVKEVPGLGLERNFSIQTLSEHVKFDFSESDFQSDFQFSIVNQEGRMVYTKQFHGMTKSITIDRFKLIPEVYVAIAQSSIVSIKKKFIVGY